MIVFVAPNPDSQEQVEGYYIRVKAIEKLFHNVKRIYLLDAADLGEKLKLLSEASMIYVHSIYMLREYFYILKPFAQKVVIDLHGVVPEEALLLGNTQSSEQLNLLEKNTFNTFSMFVVVSDAMARHYKSKYSLDSRTEFIKLPIFNSKRAVINLNKKDPDNVIYAGGLQSWQNVDLMINCVNQGNNLNFTFLTHNESELRAKINIDNGKVQISSAPPDKMSGYYKKASFGFILRDNSIVNKVACPTKLIEYLQYGIVPIVKFKDIGDFEDLGYQHLTCKQLLYARPSESEVARIVMANSKVADKLESIADDGKKNLYDLYTKLKKTNIIKPRANLIDYLELLTYSEISKSDARSIAEDRDRIVAHTKNLEGTIDKLERRLCVRFINKAQFFIDGLKDRLHIRSNK